MNNIIINGPGEEKTCVYCGPSEDGICWLPVEGFDGYFVSNDGRVIGQRGWLLKPNSGRVYYSVPLCKNGKQFRKTIHRLVAEAFIPNPLNLPMVNHKDENKWNNCADNLEWCDAKYNNTYGVNPKLGRQKVAEELAKPVEMLENGKVIAKYASIRDASRITGINRHCISRCCRGTAFIAGGFTWRFIDE